MSKKRQRCSPQGYYRDFMIKKQKNTDDSVDVIDENIHRILSTFLTESEENSFSCTCKNFYNDKRRFNRLF